ncbi:MAG: DUF971 domain-containing protein [Methylococcales bacterium]|jgi:DUF971 family protein|nr:DUF971 domain-containing protein [Methylococcales bacterium]MBT7442545.1 DUF971 domain-containing protein [Methylococcales bacterium]
MSDHIPTDINLHQKSHILEITFDDEIFKLSCEYLRVHSPSAEVQGHGPGQEVLQIGKEDVNIDKIEQVGNYAVCLFFDDDHSSGIYSWETLYDLGKNHALNWNKYLQALADAGHTRKENRLES